VFRFQTTFNIVCVSRQTWIVAPSVTTSRSLCLRLKTNSICVPVSWSPSIGFLSTFFLSSSHDHLLFRLRLLTIFSCDYKSRPHLVGLPFPDQLQLCCHLQTTLNCIFISWRLVFLSPDKLEHCFRLQSTFNCFFLPRPSSIVLFISRLPWIVFLFLDHLD
jgi:hypothetical protein